MTEAGRALLATNPARIDIGILNSFPEFHLWRTANSADPDDTTSLPRIDDGKRVNVEDDLATTPDEVISNAHSKLESALAEELLELLYIMNPTRFERLILDLLKAMGYGARSLGSHQMTRSSGDGGIDGIIHEDALGLDAVYIQAKRYAAENKVGRPAIQQFIGSLTGEGAAKGVFVTTSDFSAEARGYLARVQQRVVLIGGVQLARLMIRHGVGVRDRVSYVIKSVDEDYFADPAG